MTTSYSAQIWKPTELQKNRTRLNLLQTDPKKIRTEEGGETVSMQIFEWPPFLPVYP